MTPFQYIKTKISDDEIINVLFTGSFMGGNSPQESKTVEINFDEHTNKPGYELSFWHIDHNNIVRTLSQFQAVTPYGQIGFSKDELIVALPADLDPFLLACLTRAMTLMCRYQKEAITKLKQANDRIKELEKQLNEKTEKSITPKLILSDNREKKRIFLAGLAAGKRS